MSVVVLVLDGVGARRVTPEVMPTLTGWGMSGIWRKEGATSVMCASTYPNFASIVTGRLPIEHGILTNQVVLDGERKGAGEVGPRHQTLLDDASEVVVGDHNLIGVMAAQTAGRHWPPTTRVPDDAELDLFGYVTDAEVARRVVDALDRRPELLFVQLNSPDTFAHVFGPDSDEAIVSYRALDSTLGLIESAIRWEEDLVLVTSDHDQETIDPSKRIDLQAIAEEEGVEATAIDEGSAAMIVGPGSSDLTWLQGTPGLESWEPMGPDTSFVFSSPGWWFAHRDFPDLSGAHGGPRTRSTIAIAAGPETMLGLLRDRMQAASFGADDWHTVIQAARDMAKAGPGTKWL